MIVCHLFAFTYSTIAAIIMQTVIKSNILAVSSPGWGNISFAQLLHIDIFMASLIIYHCRNTSLSKTISCYVLTKTKAVYKTGTREVLIHGFYLNHSHLLPFRL